VGKGLAGRVVTKETILIEALAFAPNGQSLAVGTWDRREVHLFRVSDGSEILRYEAPAPIGLGLRFTPHGGGLATGLSDTSVIIWDLTRRPRVDADGRG
jgi:WD40 repeat protein